MPSQIRAMQREKIASVAPKRTFDPGPAFHWLTPSYDVVCELLGYGRVLMGRALDRIQPQPGQRLLDVGTGTGTLLVTLLQRVPTIHAVGVEPDHRILEIAKGKLDRFGMTADLREASADALPFSDDSFDWVVSTLVFHHLSPTVKRAALCEIDRVLKPGGTFLLADIGRAGNRFEWLALSFLSWFDGQANVRENIEGVLPQLADQAGFRVQIIGPRYRFVDLILAKQ